MKNADISHLFKERHDVMTVREIAQTIRCSEKHILRMIHNDELPCFQIGKQYRVLKPDIIARLRKST